MSLTDYAGIAGLVAAAVLALWMVLGARSVTNARHRGTPKPGLPRLRR
ncbi:hypothetical protein AB0I34_02100 [Kribbella sp. NPDC050281]